jgi:prevent-host-death family protein
MITVSSADCQRHFGMYSDKALREPISITRNGRERLVMVSAEEYHRLKRNSRIALSVAELTDEDLISISNTEMLSQHAHLDEEIR